MNLSNFIISPLIRLCLIVLSSLIIFQDGISCYHSSWFKEISFRSLPVAAFLPFGSAAGRLSSKFMINADKKMKSVLSRSRSIDHTDSKKRFASRKSDNDDDKKHQDEYSAMCLLKRSPRWRSNPTLHYFPSILHSPKSYGCKNSIVLPLNISKTIDLDYNDNEVVDTDEDYLLDMNLKSDLIDSNMYNKSLETYFIIHGFLASWNGSNWMCRLKDMILNNTQANVFILDWSGGSKPMLPIDYPQSVANTKYVGQLVGSFINRLLQFSGQPNASKFHLIGHSLGAHISGFIGYSVKTIGRITGLDPAGPCYGSFTPKSAKQEENAQLSGYLSGKSNIRRLSPLSADLVVALHTDTALLGLNENCGHYDIYVNGGAGQPGCLNRGIPFRVESLLELDLSDALNTDFTCSHSYAHKMIDTFTEQFNNFMPMNLGMDSVTNGLQKATSNTSELHKFLEASNKKCYPMAYECRSWNAFKAGECGFCNSDPNNDSTDNQGCVFVGVMQSDETSIAGLDGSRNQNFERQIESYHNDKNNGYDDDDGLNDDGKVNNEDYDDEQGEDDGLESSSDSRIRQKALDNVSRGQHFIRLGLDTPTCLYHYQIIIAVNSSYSSGVGGIGNSKRARHSFYLRMPLNKQATLTEPPSSSSSSNEEVKRLHDRLVQVSHVNRVRSYAHGRINTGLLDSLKENFVNFKELSVSPNNLDYYTALITFKSTSPGMCEKDDILPSKLNDDDQSKRFYLCKPLIEPKEIQLWASGEDQLEKVFWVTLNYMSNLDEKERINFSYLFTRRSNLVESRDQSKREQNSQAVPTLNELSRFSGRSSGRAFPTSSSTSSRTSLQPIDCLISTLDPIQSGSSSNNLKCKASGAELKYSLKMNPVARKPPNSKEKNISPKL